MGYAALIIVVVIILLGLFAFRGGEENETIIEEGNAAVEEAEDLKETLESRNLELE